MGEEFGYLQDMLSAVPWVLQLWCRPASQALGPPTLGPSYFAAGGAPLVARVPRCRQPPDVCVIRTQASASMQQRARGVQSGIGRSFYEAMQACIVELRPSSRWGA